MKTETVEKMEDMKYRHETEIDRIKQRHEFEIKKLKQIIYEKRLSNKDTPNEEPYK